MRGQIRKRFFILELLIVSFHNTCERRSKIIFAFYAIFCYKNKICIAIDYRFFVQVYSRRDDIFKTLHNLVRHWNISYTGFRFGFVDFLNKTAVVFSIKDQLMIYTYPFMLKVYIVKS